MVATTTMAMILYERGLLDLEMPVVGVFPEFAGDDSSAEAKSRFNVLAHSSGFPAHEKIYLQTTSKDELLREAFAVPLKS